MLIDEVYVKEGLVYNNTTGALISFIELGGMNNHLRESASSERRPIAKTVAVFIVWGVSLTSSFLHCLSPAISVVI